MAKFRPISSTATTPRPTPTARGRRCGAGGRRGCRVRGTCRRGAPKRDQHASLHSKLAEGIGATSATTAGASASLCRLDMMYRPLLPQTIFTGPSHGEQMQLCGARLFVVPMDKFAPAWGSPTRREAAQIPLRASRLSRTSMNFYITRSGHAPSAGGPGSGFRAVKKTHLYCVRIMDRRLQV